eukprot:tig00000237_g20469.t1
MGRTSIPAVATAPHVHETATAKDAAAAVDVDAPDLNSNLMATVAKVAARVSDVLGISTEPREAAERRVLLEGLKELAEDGEARERAPASAPPARSLRFLEGIAHFAVDVKETVLPEDWVTLRRFADDACETMREFWAWTDECWHDAVEGLEVPAAFSRAGEEWTEEDLIAALLFNASVPELGRLALPASVPLATLRGAVGEERLAPFVARGVLPPAEPAAPAPRDFGEIVA